MSVEVDAAPTWQRTVRVATAWGLAAGCLVHVGAVVAGRDGLSYGEYLDAHAHGRLLELLPIWLGVVSILLLVGSLALLVSGPQPRCATRWAWFWLLGVAPPVGLLAFLLLGGSTERWSPERSERRLTGGWAFLLCIVLTYALGKLGGVL